MDAMSRRRRQKGYPCNCLRPIIRLWGIITSVVLIGVGVDRTYHQKPAGIYLIIASLVVFFLEVKWIFTLFINLICANNDSPSKCANCWAVVQIFGGWRLSPLYIALGVALIIWPSSLWLCRVAGVQLLILALLRLFTIFRYSNKSTRGEGLLSKRDDKDYFDKLENASDVIDDSMPEPGHTLDDEEIPDGI